MTTTIFSAPEIQRIVDASLTTVPEGRTNALVGTLDPNGVQLVATFKLGPSNNWDVTGVARHDWTGENDVGASVIYSW